MEYFTENLRELERMRQRSQAHIDKATGALDKQNKALDKFAIDSKKNSEEYRAMMKKKIEESGMFATVELESCFILEGEQADAYKAKKIKAMNRAGDDDIRKGMHKMNAAFNKHGEEGMEKASNKLSEKSPGFKKGVDDLEDSSKRYKGRDYAKKASTLAHAYDAADRHDRRHPDRKVMEALDMLASIDYPYNG